MNEATLPKIKTKCKKRKPPGPWFWWYFFWVIYCAVISLCDFTIWFSPLGFFAGLFVLALLAFFWWPRFMHELKAWRDDD